ncbi:NAD(P)-binding protein [Nocardia miyunensis]|uniref:NAD(P)-binding protein n=1 Tax=Nocardia miyunensis TaxID=282684 RepID=UPI000A52DA62|nr:NAD(P)-binding protein [Nocardia miyunensis]
MSFADSRFDADALRRRYDAEREKRLAGPRRDIADLTGTLSRYLDDPYTPVVTRHPVQDSVEVLVVGGGMAGIVAPAELRKAGVTDTRIVDAAGDFGGVWYWNRYPGAMCDVESLVYLPYLEELGYVPRDRYASAAEIWGHLRAVARHHDLYDTALFHTRVTGMVWESMSRGSPR